MLTRSLIALVCVVGCSKRDDSKPPTPQPGSDVDVVRGRPGSKSDQQVVAEVEALEAAAQRGELEWTKSKGHDLITLGKDGKPRTQPFPIPKFDAGDSMNDAWLAPDGTLFTAGYMYTGKPGPDTGAIHRMKPGGKIERVFELPERELWSVSGRSADDVYAIGPQTVVHWDGTAWSELKTTGVEGTINTVAVTPSDVFIVAVKNDPEESRIYRLAGNSWKREVELACLFRGLSFAKTIAFAAGACNAVFRRSADGTWKPERIPERGAFDIVAVSDSVAYVAAEQLLRRNSDGSWVTVDAGFPRVHGVYAATGEHVFIVGNLVRAGGRSGVALGGGDVYKKLPLEDCEHMTANDELIYCIRERRVASAPPDDLR